mgnify:CR=1 FL=1|tara:strand:+ start:2351 stop:3139 length:789 start_codon:yes stop_codon:yes gene_type:complete
MEQEIHPGLEKVCNFVKLKNSNQIKKLYESGFLYLENIIDLEDCNKLVDDLNNLRGIYPYHLDDNKSYSGVFRSPFLSSNNYRDLLLHKEVHGYLNEIFPTNYQLHLSRCVENKATQIAATIEWHRDIPYLHSPSKFPLCISVLTFLSSCSEIQIEILKDSHDKKFYNFEDCEILRLNPKPGDALLFDSNLIHRTLPTAETVFYNLYMFSSPVIKPVVDYSSNEVLRKIVSNQYRLSEVFNQIGYDFLVPKDDFEYLNKKIY